MVLAELLSLLATEHFFIFGLKFASELFSATLDALHTHLVVAIALLEVTNGDKDRIFHLFLLLLDLLE